MKNLNFEIKLLTSCREHIPVLAKLLYEEVSRPWSPNASIERAEQKLINHLNRDCMPMAFVAVCGDEAIGMVCLRETNGMRPDVTPWLGGLVVNPSYRGRKVGETLINTVKDQTRNLGYQILNLLAFDPSLPNWYARLGWSHINYDELFGHPVTIMNISL